MNTHPVAEVVQMPVTGHNQIYVQAGAFSVMENATKLQKKLASLGKVEVSNTIVNGTKFYRVRIGPVPDVNSADSLVKRVEWKGSVHARIVID